MLDTSQNLIVINGCIRTAQIESCRDEAPNRYCIVFAGNPKEYAYGVDKVLWLKNPESLVPAIYQLAHNGRRLTNIAAIFKFRDYTQTYWHIRFENGTEKSYKGSDLQVTGSCLADPAANNIFRYLQQVAAANALPGDDGTALLAKQYDKVRFVSDETALATYLNPGLFRPQTYAKRRLIYPFGCNASQLKAVQKAFEHSVSVIQGPPGTGKTQTILNIIANILVAGKTVLVVSNNNTATDNVLEKLIKYEFGFLAAPLGNSANKQRFIESQEKEKQYPKALASWHTAEANRPEFLEQIDRQIALLNDLFAKQERLAIARQELQALETERRHFEREIGTPGHKIVLRKTGSIPRLTRVWFDLQQFAEDAALHSGFFGNMRQKLRWTALRLRSRQLLEGLSRDFFRRDLSAVISDIQTAIYDAKHRALRSEIAALEAYVASQHAEEQTKLLSERSMLYLKNALHRKYGADRSKPIFLSSDLYFKAREVLNEYPVVSSTTFSARNSLSPETTYDYVIMDEASQVSIETGALALSVARNAVIVGDTMQLPNVVTPEAGLKLDEIAAQFTIPESYDCARNSFLESVCRVIPDVPQTLLKEHYRCHPKIIDFCNRKFYGGNLVIMTRDNGESDVVCAVKTVEGNHDSHHVNQREIDVIRKEVLPTLSYEGDNIGIIAPYNAQVDALQQHLGTTIDIATVHKFQGREKNAIVMCTVDNQISEFVDDPNLLNVAVSRAKRKFCLVVTGNKQQKSGNIGDLLAYIEYNNFTVTESKIRSIFDCLYKQYTEARMAYLSTRKRISEYDSENLTYALIEEILCNNAAMRHLDVVCHLPLRMLIRDFSLLDEIERRYAENSLTHVDFLIYNKVGKQPVLAIETDGFSYHQEGSRQKERDRMKDRILELYGIPCERLSTKDCNERERIESRLKEIIRSD
ncbi:AAA domain-containing protein [uncultured Alistipes sp.]|uniref:AAA domain-containing protein n=2 Tax=uncultured Alistipes sp. TaxID=538949 RepID=UPI0026137C00|nr:AAA domain-containing protein [uncultured Alistipes sp.]